MITPIPNPNAKIIFIGDAPSRDDHHTKIPFTGKAGAKLRSLINSAGIPPEDCYFTMLFKGKESIEEATESLLNELAQHSANVLVPLGNRPLEVLTGKTSIHKHRGSIYSSVITGSDTTGYIQPRKVIGTLNPEMLLRSHGDTPTVAIDMSRIKAESATPELELPTYTFLMPMKGKTPDDLQGRITYIDTNYSMIIDELDRMIREAPYISVDIETPMDASYMKCVGLADSPYRGLCVPLVDGTRPFWSPIEEAEIWKRIHTLLTAPHLPKIAQNAIFELEVMYPWIGQIYPVFMDTLVAQNLCFPELPKGLDYLTSVYTREQYYKDDAKAGNWEDVELWRYNILDICVTAQVADSLLEQLQQMELSNLFHAYLMPLQALWFRAFQTGVAVDKEKLHTYYKEQVIKLKDLRKFLSEVAGREVNPNSPKQIKELLFTDLAMIPFRSRKAASKGKITTDDEALTKLKVKYPQHAPLLQTILDIRGTVKLIGTYLGGVKDKDGGYTFDAYKLIDSDDRCRPHTKVGVTETGRLASSKNNHGTGTNIQNQPKWLRDIFVGNFIVGDMSQVEARFVAFLADEHHLKEMFKNGKDAHATVASWVFGVDYNDAVAIQPDGGRHPMRTKAKPIMHGGNYDMGPTTFAVSASCSLADAKFQLNNFHTSFPNIRAWHQSIIRQLSENRTLVTPFGRKRTFYGWWGDSMFKQAYANVPQGTACDHINMAALRIDAQLPTGAIILMQIHDELVIECLPEDSLAIAKLFKYEVEVPVTVNGDSMVIPLDVGVGQNWKNVKDYSDAELV